MLLIILKVKLAYPSELTVFYDISNTRLLILPGVKTPVNLTFEQISMSLLSFVFDRISNDP
jgi:hypothetical protein